MDLLDFEGQELYFDEAMPKEVDMLINAASESYGTPEAEENLLQAFFLAPDNLTVLVALYRYYYYQHQYEKALVVADHALKFSGPGVNFPKKWQDLTIEDVGAGAIISMGIVRFYLLSLKAAGYLNMRLHNFELAQQMLNKVVELDASNRLGAAELLVFAMEQTTNGKVQSIKVASN
jgi:tetratricopeptide (TPR) repeat protein